MDLQKQTLTAAGAAWLGVTGFVLVVLGPAIALGPLIPDTSSLFSDVSLVVTVPIGILVEVLGWWCIRRALRG